MNRWSVIVSAGLTFSVGSQAVRADEIPPAYRETVRKGLEWLAKQQHKDGHWGGVGDQSPVALTSLAGIALLMEGSTIREGKYADNIRRATNWLMERSMRGGSRDGLIGNPDHPNEAGRYMYGHGFGLLFLSCVYGDEEEMERRVKLNDILTRAVRYCAAAQSSRGGWYYFSKAEGGDQDEGSVTITQIQALRAARNAGIPVSRQIVKRTYDYLKECTGPNGGIYYSYRVRQEKPAITAAGIACLFSAGEYKDELCKRWFKFCQRTIGLGSDIGVGRLGHDEYAQYYYGQCVYILGDDGWDRLYGAGTPAADRITWSKYRAQMFEHLRRTQTNDGSWPGAGTWGVGPVYTAAMYLTILQLDNGNLPIYQR